MNGVLKKCGRRSRFDDGGDFKVNAAILTIDETNLESTASTLYTNKWVFRQVEPRPKPLYSWQVAYCMKASPVRDSK